MLCNILNTSIGLFTNIFLVKKYPRPLNAVMIEIIIIAVFILMHFYLEYTNFCSYFKKFIYIFGGLFYFK
jgi:hypothetical protein